MYTKQQLDALSGAKDYAQTPLGGAYYDTITLGKDGKFYIAHYSQPKDTREDPKCLEGAFEMTIVKIRRKMTAWVNGTKNLESVEYDAGATEVLTTNGMMSEAQAKSFGASVSLVVYGIYNGKTVKMQVSGGSLYNPEDTQHLRLYTYLQSYSDTESVYDYATIVGAKLNHYTDGAGIARDNYQMVFKRSDKASDLEAVGATLTELATQLPENDARDARFLGRSTTQAPQADATAKAFDNLADNPF
jgi:hypothetical protein